MSGQRRFAGFDDKILALYARGMTVREIPERYAGHPRHRDRADRGREIAFPPDVRRVIYTTNALESVHARIRTIIKTRGQFPTDDAATKLIWLALRNITARWSAKSANYWHLAMQQFAICDGDRFTEAAS